MGERGRQLLLPSLGLGREGRNRLAHGPPPDAVGGGRATRCHVRNRE